MAKTEEQRLQWIKDRLRSVPEGKSLLDFAISKNISIRFNPKLSGTRTHGQYEPGVEVELNPSMADEELVYCLAHELRHVWQDHLLKFSNSKYLSPLQRIVFNRFIEGDAFAFRAFIVQRLRGTSALGSLKKAFGDKGPDYQKCLQEEFIKFQQDERGRHYDKGAVEDINDERRQMIEHAHKNGHSADTIDEALRMTQSKTVSEAFNNVSNVTARPGQDRVGFMYLGARSTAELTQKILQYVPPSTRMKLS